MSQDEIKNENNRVDNEKNRVDNESNRVDNENSHEALIRELELLKKWTEIQINRLDPSSNEINDNIANQTAEIIQLITTDTLRTKQLEKFEQHMRRSTDTAIESIRSQAKKEGQGLTRKITIPITTISALFIILQFLLQHFHLLR